MVGCGCERSLYCFVCIHCLFENTHTKVCDETKASNSIHEHQIQLLASMNYASFIDKVLKDIGFRTRDEKGALWDCTIYSKETALDLIWRRREPEDLWNVYISCSWSTLTPQHKTVLQAKTNTAHIPEKDQQKGCGVNTTCFFRNNLQKATAI